MPNWDWRLRTETDVVEFGDDNSPIVVSSWSAVPAKARLSDSDNPRMDGVRFGRELRAGQRIGFALWMNGLFEHDAREFLSKFGSAWRNDAGRMRGGVLAELRHPDGKRVYGRPRGFSYDAQRVDRGWVTGAAEFEAVDDLWYGPSQEFSMGLVPEFTGGLPVPAEVPFVLGGGTGSADRIVTVGGDAVTWPVFELQGPIADPWIDVPGKGRLIFQGELAYDQVLEVDTRPWARWVKRDGNAFPGALSPAGARLADMGLEPGSYQVMFGGYDPSGTSSLTVRVESAFTSF